MRKLATVFFFYAACVFCGSALGLAAGWAVGIVGPHGGNADCPRSCSCPVDSCKCRDCHMGGCAVNHAKVTTPGVMRWSSYPGGK